MKYIMQVLNGVSGESILSKNVFLCEQPIDTCDLILICGIPASGKTYLTQNRYRNRVRLNRDDIRFAHKRMISYGQKWMQSDFDLEFEKIFSDYEMQLLHLHLQRGHKIVVDDTNVTRTRRKFYVDVAKALGKTVGILFLNSPVELCLERNRNRENVIPETIVRKYNSDIELPHIDEGFDVVEII